MTKREFQQKFTELTDMPENRFHPLVWIGGYLPYSLIVGMFVAVKPEYYRKLFDEGIVSLDIDESQVISA